MQHTHPVKRILFVTPDPDDKKIFGYVCRQPDCSTGYKLYSLKSENVRGTKEIICFVEWNTGNAKLLIVGDMMHGLGLRHVLFAMFCY